MYNLFKIKLTPISKLSFYSSSNNFMTSFLSVALNIISTFLLFVNILVIFFIIYMCSSLLPVANPIITSTGSFSLFPNTTGSFKVNIENPAFITPSL